MSLTLYDTLTKGEKDFVPLTQGKVTMYTCGPTVYGRPHIGNLSSFLMADLLRRWLEVNGYEVTHVKNITDVGHLVADADTGEDKIEKQAREEFGNVSMESVLGIARKYENQYLEDERALNMREPEHRPRATDFIAQMRDMTGELLKDGHAYVTDDGIYFDVTSKKDYGKLSGNTLDNLQAGARVDVNEQKKHPADFALWKFCVGSNEHHVLRWPSPKSADGKTFPEGFPGWHIECSAMSRALLGDQLDIHTGGEDNIFPHHECEIAQSESVTGKTFVGTWLHKRRIDLEGEKMSKSIGNIVTLDDIREKGFDVMDLRYYFLSVHYRTNQKFSWKGLEDARKARLKIMEWMTTLESTTPTTDASSHSIANNEKDFSDHMNEDLNVSAAIADIFAVMNIFHKDQRVNENDLKTYRAFIKMIRDTFGCFDATNESIPADVQSLVDARADARKNKDFAASDRLRDEIADKGYEVRDTSDGQVVRKK